MTTPFAAMRPLLILLAPLLLAGCYNDSATYYADEGREHTLTVRRQQDYFWSEEARYTLMAARLPDCQRMIPLSEMALEDAAIELFGSGGNRWSLRAGKQVWHVETTGCTLLGEDAAPEGQKLGVFRAGQQAMVFEPVPDAVPPQAAPAETPQDAGAVPAEAAVEGGGAPADAPEAAAQPAAQAPN